MQSSTAAEASVTAPAALVPATAFTGSTSLRDAAAAALSKSLNVGPCSEAGDGAVPLPMLLQQQVRARQLKGKP